MSKLTPKQEAFCLAYARHGNATQAAEDAGYKGDRGTLGTVGDENMKKPAIIARLQELANEITSPKIASIEERKEFLTRVMRGEETEQAVTEFGVVDVAPKMADRIKAADIMNKCDGVYVQKVDMNAEVSGATILQPVYGVPEDGEGDGG